jgi:hypothetical protein
VTLTSEGVETIQRKCSTSTKENEVVWKARPLQVSLVNQEVKYDLIAQEVESAEYRRGMSSTYTTRPCTRGVVLHMLGGQEACTEGAVIHKAAARKYGHKGGTEGAQRGRISRY